MIEEPAWAFVGCCKYTRCVGAPGFTVNELLVPAGSGGVPMAVAVIVKLPVFVIVTLKLLRTPFVNDGVVGAPENVRVPVEVRLTLSPLPLKLVAVLLKASWAVIVTLKAVPAVCGLAMVAKANLVTVPAFTVKLLLVAPARPVLAALNVNDPACVGTRLENVARPLTAATEVVDEPANVPPPLMVTVAVLLVWFPYWSWI